MLDTTPRPKFVTCEICSLPVSVAAKGRIPSVHPRCAPIQFALNALSTALERWDTGAEHSNEERQAMRRLVVGHVFSECNGRFNRGKPNGSR